MSNETKWSLPIIETFTGRMFDLSQPREEDVCIEDIAHALARICRFTGHSSSFYSVAEHSDRASRLPLPAQADHPSTRLAILLHDAHEAYVGDVSTPLKVLLPDYRSVEEAVSLVVRSALWVPAAYREQGLELPGSFDRLVAARERWPQDVVKKADLSMLLFEAAHLMPSQGSWWSFPMQGVKTDACLGNGFALAERLFLERYYDLMEQTKQKAQSEA